MKTLLASLTLFWSGATCAYPVIGISDGDTLTVLVDRAPVRVRLSDIDAPESRQGFGARAKQALSDLCFGKDAVLDTRTTDRYGRIVARVTCAGVDANRAMVEAGMAWHYARYSHDMALAALEAQARQERRGLWTDPAAVAPWDFRRK